MNKKFIGCLTAFAMSLSLFSINILPAKAENNNIDIAEIENGNEIENNLSKINELDDDAIKLQIEETEDNIANQSMNFLANNSTGTRYPWNYRTYPYDFNEQKWSTNKDIYDTYPSIGEGKYQDAKSTSNLVNPTGPNSYKSTIREGYLRKDGELQYFDFVASGICNNVMIMSDSDVKCYIFEEKDTLVNVMSDSSNSLIGATKEGRTINGRNKTVINLQLKDGDYLICFTIKTVSDKNHYALYTGCPLPIKNSAMFAGTHKGKVSWNGGGLKAETEAVCPSITISTPSGVNSDLFVLSKVWFEDKSMGGAQDLYVSDVQYYYASPASSYYRSLSKSGKNYYDNAPSPSTVAGTYKTKFRVTWNLNLSYVNAAYYGNTIMHIEYLTPYGMYKGM